MGGSTKQKTLDYHHRKTNNLDVRGFYAHRRGILHVEKGGFSKQTPRNVEIRDIFIIIIIIITTTTTIKTLDKAIQLSPLEL
jgi:hypothetical protein